MSIEPVMTSKHLILCRPLLLLPSVFTGIRVFSNKSALLLNLIQLKNLAISIFYLNHVLVTKDTATKGIVCDKCGTKRWSLKVKMFGLLLCLNCSHSKWQTDKHQQ